MAQKALGIEIGEGEVRGALLEGSAKKYRLIGFARAPIEAPKEGETPEDLVSDAIADVAERLHEGKETSAVAISSTRCSFRPLTLPFVGHEQIRQVVKFELEGHLHQWNIDDVVVDFYTSEESKGKSQLLVAAAPKDYLRRIFGVCEQAGFDPVVADLDATALFNAAMASGALEPESSHLLIHMGKSVALLLIVERQVLKLARCIRTSKPKSPDAKVGGEKQPEKLSEEGKEESPLGVLDKVPENPGPPKEQTFVESLYGSSGDAGGDEEVFVSIEEEGGAKELSAVLQREVNRTLTSIRLETPLSGIFLSGEWEGVEGLADALASRFQLPVLDLDLLSRIEHGLGEAEADSASNVSPVALGAALKLMDVDFGGMNFRQEELRFTKRFDQVKRELVMLLSAVLLLLVMENIYLFKNNRSDYYSYAEAGKLKHGGSLGNMINVAVKRFEGYGGKEYPVNAAMDPLKIIPDIRAKAAYELEALKKKFGQDAELKLPPSALEAWRLVFLAIQEIEPRIGGPEGYRIEKIDISTQEGGTRKESSVLVRLDFAFLGSPTTTSTSQDEMRKYFEANKKWTLSGAMKTEPLTQFEGIKTQFQIEVVVPEGQP